MRQITFLLQGRLGNALYEYFATKVLQQYLSTIGLDFQYTQINRHKLHKTEDSKSHHKSTLFVYEEVWYETLQRPKEYFEPYDLIVLKGYFQTNDWVIDNRDWIKSKVFIETNTERISDEPGHHYFQIDQLVKDAKNAKVMNKNELVVHIRLDDFAAQGYNSFVINPLDYVTLIKQIHKDEGITCVVFVLEKVKYTYEAKYVETLYSNLKDTLQVCFEVNKTVAEDFSRLLYADKVVASNGTFAWIPIILGNSTKNWIPKNHSVAKVDKCTPESISWDYTCWKI
jgi:hypothetical protein